MLTGSNNLFELVKVRIIRSLNQGLLTAEVASELDTNRENANLIKRKNIPKFEFEVSQNGNCFCNRKCRLTDTQPSV